MLNIPFALVIQIMVYESGRKMSLDLTLTLTGAETQAQQQLIIHDVFASPQENFLRTPRRLEGDYAP